MQDVTVCPFRVVDEINQGMDPINERKVFMQLVESACRLGTPQCFLLTPKLLPALPFTAAVSVLQIWNGPTIKQVVGSFDQASSLIYTFQRLSQCIIWLTISTMCHCYSSCFMY